MPRHEYRPRIRPARAEYGLGRSGIRHRDRHLSQPRTAEAGPSSSIRVDCDPGKQRLNTGNGAGSGARSLRGTRSNRGTRPKRSRPKAAHPAHCGSPRRRFLDPPLRTLPVGDEAGSPCPHPDSRWEDPIKFCVLGRSGSIVGAIAPATEDHGREGGPAFVETLASE